ncbi:MAG: RNA 3'-terminal phosphate cyclase [Candidatus Diapherotrites archaeon]|nr:RNA 3'-terminal phosphate cyclase [Candidatus Diapherotrites archaeon]
MIEVDGSYLEGGGQIVRTAIALSALTGKEVKIVNIRAKRRNPGLKEQHVNAIKGVAELCDAEVDGDTVGSKTVHFRPNKLSGKRLKIRIGTAGSIGLVLQSVLIPCFALKRSVIDIEGGATFGKWAPPLYYIKYVLSPLLRQMGYNIDIHIERHGFYPVGSAKVHVETRSREYAPLRLDEQTELISIEGISTASKHLEKSKVAHRQAKEVRRYFFEKAGMTPDINIEYVDTKSIGSGIVLWARTKNGIIGADALGERGKRAEDVGREAASLLNKELKLGAVDRWAADQLIPYMAIVGNSVIKTSRLTNHCKTNIWVTEIFMEKKFVVHDNVIKVI